MAELPHDRPSSFDAGTLLRLASQPPLLGAWAMEVRGLMFGRRTLLRPTIEHAVPSGPALLRRDELIELDTWPAPEAWQAGDRLMLPIEPGDDQAAAYYVHWLLALAHHHTQHPLPALPQLGPCSIAPFSADPAGTHRLWAIAVARLVLPAAIRVEARHDLVGIRLAQVALGFGADTLAGPIAPERHLPVAGVPRPDETTITGLHKLIEQAGLECALFEDTAPRMHEAGQQTLRIKLSDLDLRLPATRGKQDPKS
jgi:hypothetical protein